MNEENLEFIITLSGIFWSKHPQYSIWLDEQLIVASEIAGKAQQPVHFTRKVIEGSHSLKIRLENKTPLDTIVVDNTVTNDMLLNIDDISIDGISLGELLWKQQYILDEPQEYQGEIIKRLDKCVNLGWNGTYILNFNSPFYIWLLENI